MTLWSNVHCIRSSYRKLLLFRANVSSMQTFVQAPTDTASFHMPQIPPNLKQHPTPFPTTVAARIRAATIKHALFMMHTQIINSDLSTLWYTLDLCASTLLPKPIHRVPSPLQTRQQLAPLTLPLHQTGKCLPPLLVAVWRRNRCKPQVRRGPCF